MRLKLENYSKGEFPLVVLPVKGNANFPLHTHDYLELVIVLGGSGIHETGEEEYRITAGDVFVITGHLEHGYRNAAELYFVNVLFDFQTLELPMHDLRSLPGFNALFEIEPKFRKEHEFKSRLKLTYEHLSRARQILFEIRKELQGKSPGYKALSCSLLTELLVFLSRRFSPASSLPECQTIYAFGEIVSYLEEHYASEISIDQLARRAKMSKRNFQRLFQKAMGISPISYLLSLRMDKAREILKNSDKPISQIAIETGFEDSNYFSRQFKKIMGMTPRRFRAIERHAN